MVPGAQPQLCEVWKPGGSFRLYVVALGKPALHGDQDPLRGPCPLFAGLGEAALWMGALS